MEIGLRKVFEANVQVAPIMDLGDTPYGRRRIIPVLSGSLEGPDIRGKILPGGADWQFIRNDGVIELEAKYWVETHDGVLISVVNRGLRHAPQDIMDRMNRGEAVDPSDVYFRSVPTFEAPAGPYEWLNRSLFVANLERMPDKVRMAVFQIL
ncbi:MAG: DUF3237 domain-containing protein [Proteobacteria bacterium]|nr:DUF3237 domain-containing protein [Pseudomonadota bacterium]